MRELRTSLGVRGDMRAAAAVGNAASRGRERSAPERQWELLATKTIHRADSPRNTGQSQGSKRSQGRESRVGTWQSKRSTKSGRQRVLGPGEGSAETVDHGKLASQYSGRWMQQWGRERWSDGAGETVGLEGTMRVKGLSSSLKHSSPHFHFSSNVYVSSH